MPRIKSAIKRVEVAERNREKNRTWKSSIRTVRNGVTEACQAKDTVATTAALNRAFATIDAAVSKGVLHKNTAARRKSRLVKIVRKAQGN